MFQKFLRKCNEADKATALAPRLLRPLAGDGNAPSTMRAKIETPFLAASRRCAVHGFAAALAMRRETANGRCAGGRQRRPMVSASH
jgi:hypothetical protein